ncbi:hypothetical protein [Knoellia sp. LjRoot47]|uniref:hypothetical protein n=1 Tax=Knoellia sp. LjRoot47 TaxID=3342330 RepID=UPI003ECD66FB
MRELLTRRRSPRALLGIMVLAWIVTVGTMQAGDSAPDSWLRIPMALVMIVGLAVSAACLLLFLVQSFRR